MTRLANWQNNLSELIEANRHKPFDFKNHNCLMWAMNGIEVVIGEDYFSEYRGKYKSETEAVKLLKKIDDVTTSKELIELKLGQKLQPTAFARMGDIVLASDELDGLDLPTDCRLFGPVPGICYGTISYFVGFDGLIEVETLRLSGTLWVS